MSPWFLSISYQRIRLAFQARMNLAMHKDKLIYTLLLFFVTFSFPVLAKAVHWSAIFRQDKVILSSHSWNEGNVQEYCFYVSIKSIFLLFAPMRALKKVSEVPTYESGIFRVFWGLTDLIKHSLFCMVYENIV